MFTNKSWMYTFSNTYNNFVQHFLNWFTYILVIIILEHNSFFTFLINTCFLEQSWPQYYYNFHLLELIQDLRAYLLQQCNSVPVVLAPPSVYHQIKPFHLANTCICSIQIYTGIYNHEYWKNLYTDFIYM